MHFPAASLLLLSALVVGAHSQQCHPTLEYQCSDNQCISATWRCDGRPDCVDGGDEQNCACLRSEFRCNSDPAPAICISGQRRCDGVKDCANNADEMNCLCDVQTEFQCRGQQMECVSRSWLCDGDPDCDDMSDEFNCTNMPISPGPLSCLPNERACGNNSRCVPKEWFCDRQVDCTDRSDETNCTNMAIPSCPSGRTPCADHSQCFPPYFFCDGEIDCFDGSDEVDCSSTITQPPTAAPPPPCPSGNLADCDGRSLTFMVSATTEVRFLRLTESSQQRLSPILVNSTNIIPLAYVENDNGLSRLYYADEEPSLTRFRVTTLDFSGSAPTAGMPREFLTSTDGNAPQGFAIDWISKRLYWTSLHPGNGVAAINVAGLDGQNHYVVYRIRTKNTRPGHIAVDARRGLIFWAERSSPQQVRRINVLGNDVMTVSPQAGRTLGTPTGIALDTANQLIYIADRGSGNVERLSYDGAMRTTLFRDKLEDIRSLAFFAGNLYATQVDRTNVGKLLRVRLGFPNPPVDTLRTGLRSPQDLRAVGLGVQPPDATNPCSNSNGGCQAVCLSVSSTAVCSCDGVTGQQFLAANRQNCSATPTVLMTQGDSITVGEGSTLTLSCSIIQSPSLSITAINWRRGGRLLAALFSTTRSDGITYTSTLNAANVANGNSGNYNCELVYSVRIATATINATGADTFRSSSPAIQVNISPTANSSSNTTAIIIGVVVGLVLLAIIVAVIIIVVVRMRRSSGVTTFGNPMYNTNTDDKVTMVKTSSSSSSGPGGSGTPM